MSAWSKDVPTAPGFYWCHQYGRTRMVSVWKYPDPERDTLFTNEDGAPLDDMEMYEGAMWSGPIQPQRSCEGGQMNCHERIGLAIERAAEKLPHGYEIVLAIEADAGSVSLFIPPVSDDEGGRMVDEWGESDLTDNVNKAVDMAIEHYDRVKGG